MLSYYIDFFLLFYIYWKLFLDYLNIASYHTWNTSKGKCMQNKLVKVLLKHLHNPESNSSESLFDLKSLLSCAHNVILSASV